jgi:hypothetical protein
MKRQTAKPAEHIMRFFTPELYRRFNSSNDEQADEANEAWEKAIAKYQQHLNDIRGGLPTEVRKLTELSLHDAELLGIEEDFRPFPSVAKNSAEQFWSAIAIVSLMHDDDVLSLIYFLWDKIRKRPAEEWPFSRDRLHWLFDEIDVVSNGGPFVHRILLSNGTAFEIPFASVVVYRLPLRPQESANTRQSA